MHFKIKGFRIYIELQPVIIAMLIAGWALYYHFSTVAIPRLGPRSVLFTKPWTIMAVVAFVIVVIRAIKIQTEERSSPRIQEDKPTQDRGFLDHRRIFFALSLAFYSAGIALFGYLIPSIIFILVVTYYLGVRNRWILLLVPLVIPVFLSFAFRALRIPIPIFPAW